MNTTYVIRETHKLQDEEERKIMVSQKLAQVMKSDRQNKNHLNLYVDDRACLDNCYQL